MNPKLYEKKTCEQLRSLLRDRRLPVSGNKNELINRLQDADKGLPLLKKAPKSKDTPTEKKPRKKKEVPKKPYWYLSRLILPSLDISPDYFSVIPLDILLQMCLGLSSLDLYVLGMSSPYMINKILRNEEFWKRYHKMIGQASVPKDIVTFYHKMIRDNMNSYHKKAYHKVMYTSIKYGLLTDLHLIFDSFIRNPTINDYERGLHDAILHNQLPATKYFLSKGVGEKLDMIVLYNIIDKNREISRYILNNYSHKLNKRSIDKLESLL